MSITRLQAELYALTHRGHPGDRSFYAQACGEAERVLELGTGFGRLLATLAVSEARRPVERKVWGLDREPRLLQMARQAVRQLPSPARARIKLTRGDMRDFDFRQRFDRILLPYSGFYCLLNRRDALRCLKSVASDLAPKGQFIFDVWSADEFQREAASSAYRDEPGPILSFGHRGQTWDVFEKSRLRTRLQRLDVAYTYVSRESGTRVTVPIAHRYAPRQELYGLLEAAGLRVLASYGDFEGHRFGRRSELLVVKSALA